MSRARAGLDSQLSENRSYIPVVVPIFLYKLAAPRGYSIITWPPFFEYNKRLLRQKTGGACLNMPQDDHWLAS